MSDNYPNIEIDPTLRVDFSQAQQGIGNGDAQFSDSRDGSGGNHPGGPGGNRIIPVPIPIPVGIGSIIDMTRWAIAITPSRMQFFYWVLLLVVNGLCLLTTLLFWAFALMFLKSLTTWTGIGPLIRALWSFRPWWLGGEGQIDLSGLWRQLFPEAERMGAYSLQIILHQTGQVGAAILNEIRFPLLLGNPIFWACAMLIMFICHSIFSFIYRCMILTDRARVRTGRY